MVRPFVEPTLPTRARRLHNAMWLLHHLAGRRISHGLTGGLRERVDTRLRSSIDPAAGALHPIPEVHSIDEFVDNHLKGGPPALFRGAARDWPAVKEWTPAFFKERFGDEPVRLLRMAPDEVGERDFAPIETVLGDALDRLHEGDCAYCRFLPFLMQDPEMKAMLDMDWFRARRGPMAPQENLQLFIGGAGTSTAIHAAISANFFVQVQGRKIWKIYSPDWSFALRPPMQRSLYFMSDFDPDAPDYEAFPEARALTGYEVELEPGDILYNPPFWWHKVRNPTVTVGVAFRFMPPEAIWKSSRILSILTALAVDPPLLVSPLVKLDFTKIFTTRPLSRPVR